MHAGEQQRSQRDQEYNKFSQQIQRATDMPNLAQHGPRKAVLSLLVVIQIHLAVILYLLQPSSAGVLKSNHTAVEPIPCLPDHASSLLRLKRSFITNDYSLIAFRSWRIGTDCCGWVGVRCASTDGRVTSLDLAERELESGGLDPVLFDLTSLEYLNLAYNNFNGSQLPSIGFERLNKLRYLNLSTSHFYGQLPVGISHLTNLVSLDLSLSNVEVLNLIDGAYLTLNDHPELREQNIATFIAKLNNLRQLHLGWVDLSNSEKLWCDALATSCPKLRVLSLPGCGLSGRLCASLLSMQSLSVIDLQYNNLYGPVPSSLTNLSNLSAIHLTDNNLQGWISPTIFLLQKLMEIDLSQNPQISGYLPNFSAGSRLEILDIGGTNFSGTIPASIGNLTYLNILGLGANLFRGEIPSSIGNLRYLRELDFSGTELIGSMPYWVANLTSLTSLRFYHCGLSGSIPSFISELTYLKELMLLDCGFSGEILSLVSNLTQLQVLWLQHNNFVGTTDLNFTKKMPSLMALGLSYSNLLVLDCEDNSSLKSFPKILKLHLAGCGMSTFPRFLICQHQLVSLILADNKIHGAIPQWVWEEVGNNIGYLNLRNNSLTSIGYSPFLPLEIDYIDLRDNMFEGPIPIPKGSPVLLLYTNNRFSSIPSNFCSHLSSVVLFLASMNNISGKIPTCFCGATNIEVLDLSYNKFTGPIPLCLMQNINGIKSLYLVENQLHGHIPDVNKEGCSFKALDFSRNRIKGQLPRSLIACKNLEIFDVGNNQINDTFPCWMSELHKLHVLILKSNKFFGHVATPLQEEKHSCAFPSAIIMDLSSNNFFGPLPEDQWFKNLRSMISRDANMSLVMGYVLPKEMGVYPYAIAITYKGHGTIFQEILTELVFIDFSNNAFNGGIPTTIGELGLLRGINISRNSLIGPIPFQLGHLNLLEALDLSFNELSGEIPQDLASLNFLTTLDLSHNKLVGSTPQSPHFLTFPNSSFDGNDGLCGPSLSKECINTTTSIVVSHHSKKKPVDIVLFLFVGLGFGVGFATAIVLTWAIPIKKRRT